MKRTMWLLALVCAAAIAPVAAQEKGGVDATGPYDVVTDWLKPIEDGWTTYVVGVMPLSKDRIFLSATGAAPGKQVGMINMQTPGTALKHLLFVVDRNGKVVEEWSQWFHLFANPHSARVNPYDPEKHIWFIDRDAQQLFEFTNDGKQLVKTIGEHGVAGNDDKHFGRPAELAWLPDGTFFVADGYQNRRVVKFDKNGKFLMAWGTEGTGRGQFGLVHCVAVDAKRRVYVADPVDHRIQVFDENGKFLDEWPNIPGPLHIVITQDQSVWVSDMASNRMLKYNTDGKLLTYWGVQGTTAGVGLFNAPHDFTVDADGTLFVNNGFNHTVEKFVPKPNADRSRLIGQPFK